MVLITNKNNPRVTKVMGNVKKIIIGLINIFNTPKTIATVKAAFRFATLTPGSKLDIAKTATVVRISFNIVFIVYFKIYNAIIVPIIIRVILAGNI